MDTEIRTGRRWVKRLRPNAASCDKGRVHRWFAVSIDVPDSQGEAVGDFLLENGSPGLELEEHNGHVTLTAYFTAAPSLAALRSHCRILGLADTQVSVRVREIAEEDWAENWKAHFRPLPIGERLYVCPPWDTATPAGRIAVVIDPGMAFGTGHHATTRGCLLLLDAATREGHVARALDVGTGSGILAIALAKLGVPEIWAVDSDPQAGAIAAENAQRNAVASQLRFGAQLTDVTGCFDLIVANLFIAVLEELAPSLTARLAAGGTLICSGVLEQDERRLRASYPALHPIREVREPPWLTVALRRNRT